MNADGIESFERQAAELIAVVKGLVREFEARIGEAVSTQRVAASEARAEGVKITGQLENIGRYANDLLTRQRTLLTQIEKDWQLHIDENARRAGAEQARQFGEALIEGVCEPLAVLARDIQNTTARFTWASLLKWGGGIGLGIALTIALGVKALVPSVDDLSPSQVRTAMSHLASCQIDKKDHVCIDIDDKPRIVRGLKGDELVVRVKGM
jgi:hypothetical protein